MKVQLKPVIAVQSLSTPAVQIRICSRSSKFADFIYLVLITFAWAGSTAWAQAVQLGTAGNFGVLAGSAVANTGATVVKGSVGVSPGTSITGFPPGSISPGSGAIHAADAVAQQAQSDLTTAWVDAQNRVCNTTIAGGVLGGLTLTPGVYCMATANLTGTLTLNGAGVYIFQIGSALTTAPSASVVATNGASACNIFWQVTSSATIDTGTAMLGNLLALSSITMNTGATMSGRALARNAAVTLDTVNIVGCAGANGTAPTTIESQTTPLVQIGSAIHDTAILGGGTSPTGTITFSLYGPNDATCSATPIFTSTVNVNGNGNYVSANFIPTLPGNYRWIASYSGDSGNDPASGPCNSPNESVNVLSGPIAAIAIPATSDWGTLLLALLILTATLMGVRRKTSA